MSAKKVHVRPLGGSLDRDGHGIGRSGHLVTYGELGILFDAGLRPRSALPPSERHTHEPRAEFPRFRELTVPVLDDPLELPEVLPVEDVDRRMAVGEEALPLYHYLDGIKELAIVITHGHLDHGGGLPFILKHYPHAHVFISTASYAISEIWWRDSVAIAEREGFPPLYGDADILRVYPRVTFVEEGSIIDFHGVQLEFVRAGHMLGALACRFSIPIAGRRVVQGIHTGDISLKPSEAVEGADFARLVSGSSPDVIMIETTYGDREPVPERVLLAQLAQTIDRCMNRGGKLFFGAFAVRVQRLFATLQRLGVMERYPIWIDGAGAKIAQVYQAHGVPGFEKVDQHFVENWKMRYDLVRSPGRAIILAPSGTYEGGMAPWWFLQLASDPKNVIGVPSRHMDPCWPGSRILTTQPGDLITMSFNKKDQTVPLLAEVEAFGFTAHIEREEILEIRDRLRPQNTLLIHGDREAMQRVKDAAAGDAVMTEIGELYEI